MEKSNEKKINFPVSFKGVVCSADGGLAGAQRPQRQPRVEQEEAEEDNRPGGGLQGDGGHERELQEVCAVHVRLRVRDAHRESAPPEAAVQAAPGAALLPRELRPHEAERGGGARPQGPAARAARRRAQAEAQVLSLVGRVAEQADDAAPECREQLGAGEQRQGGGHSQ